MIIKLKECLKIKEKYHADTSQSAEVNPANFTTQLKRNSQEHVKNMKNRISVPHRLAGLSIRFTKRGIESFVWSKFEKWTLN